MIRSIASTNSRGQTLRIKLEDTQLYGFVLISASGLGAPDAVVNTIEGYSDGVRVTHAKTKERYIELSIGIVGSGDFEESARRQLYDFFPIAKEIKLEVETDTRTMDVDTWVESFEFKMFAQVEHAVISLKCPKSYLEEDQIDEGVIQGTTPLFQFPYSNESLDTPLTILGEIQDQRLIPVDYPGQIATGLKFTLTATGDVHGFNIFNNTANQSLHIDTLVIQQMTGTILSSGDTLIIDTRIGEKSVTLIRDGISINVLNALDPSVVWITLESGVNELLFTADSGFENIVGTMEYSILHQGV